MISFRMDSRSVVPPYLQIVQQVRQALRMGLLDVGDQLPAVREVVAATAVNPNTVLKAYRDLEREGLVEARAGHGPNGAGKTTLLRLLAGLAWPTSGELAVLGGVPRQDPAFLAEIGFLAQEIPLYRRFTVEDHLSIGARLNHRWDAASARDRLRSLRIPLDRQTNLLVRGSGPVIDPAWESSEVGLEETVGEEK